MATIIKDGREYFGTASDMLPITLRHSMTPAGKPIPVAPHGASKATIRTDAGVGVSGRMAIRKTDADRVPIAVEQVGADVVCSLPAGLELLYVVLDRDAEFAVELEA